MSRFGKSRVMTYSAKYNSRDARALGILAPRRQEDKPQACGLCICVRGHGRCRHRGAVMRGLTLVIGDMKPPTDIRGFLGAPSNETN